MTEPISTAEHSYPSGSIIAEKYRVEGLLGTGGMGAVLEATHVALGHRVALKVLHPSAVGVGDAIPRFLREARATAALESEHVIKIFDLGTTPDGMPFLVMERLSGFDLDDLLGQLGPLPVGLAIECVYQAALGVSEAHSAGIIHRDLKPSNLFVSKTGDERLLLKVLDFGISKLQQEGQDVRLTETRTIVGSPQYMSPEQVRDARSVSPQSDVWALGAILHELLEGKPAFTGDTLPSVCAAIVSDEPAPLRRSDVPPELDRLRLRCLEKTPAERVASVAELIAQLDALRIRFPSPSVDELAVVFPTRTSRQSLDRVGSSRDDRAIHSQATIAESGGPWDNTGTSGVRDALPGPTPPTLNSATITNGRGRTSSGHRSTILASAAVLAMGAVAVAFVLRSESDEVPTQLAREPIPALSLLDISSDPMGALITEKGRVLGQTPTNIELSFAERPTRELELRLDGYHPHLLTVSAQNLGRPIEIDLVPIARSEERDDAQPENEGVSPGPQEAAPSSKTAAPRPVARPKPSPAPTPSPTPDIRMSR